MSQTGWSFLDVAELLRERTAGATTSANVGAYPVPLGTPLRRADLTGRTSDGIPEELPDDIRQMLGLPLRK